MLGNHGIWFTLLSQREFCLHRRPAIFDLQTSPPKEISAAADTCDSLARAYLRHRILHANYLWLQDMASLSTSSSATRTSPCVHRVPISCPTSGQMRYLGKIMNQIILYPARNQLVRWLL